MIEFKYIMLILYVIADCWMDELNFHRPHDKGYWSLHTKDQKCSWHHTKKLSQAAIILAIFGLNWIQLIVAAAIIWILHEIFLHYIFKNI